MEAELSRDFEAFLDELTIITILLPSNWNLEVEPSFSLLCQNGTQQPLAIILYEEHESFIKYQCKVAAPLNLREEYIVSTGSHLTDLQIGSVVRTAAFDEAYAYFGDDLGVSYAKTLTTFKVWAPTASKVRLKLIDPVEEKESIVEMTRFAKGIWKNNIEIDLDGFYYSYLVCVNQVWREAVDPYAKSVSVNGEYGVIIDSSKIKMKNATLPSLAQYTDAIIYETHIRDFTIHPNSEVVHKGTYKGFAEETTDTGLNYVKNLGITHIELLPINDFAGVDEEQPNESYNWGYNPLHYFAPEGSYATNPRDPYKRIQELQDMIERIQSKGLRVIIDVVFNHVYIKEESSFEKIVPGYYFRYDLHGFPSNGTGVGNDIASERLMVRKFIIDCVLYWTTTFNVDGFRFDLMGIIDIQTMNEIKDAVHQINPSIILLGEGWELNTPLPISKKATIKNSAKMPGIAHFNDRFRDTIKGSTFNLYDRGFSLGNYHHVEEIKKLIAGSSSIFKSPSQSINYIEAHDNHTFWDKAIKSNHFEEEEVIRKRQKFATSMVLLSQGVPFLHSGQEFYRTKNGVGNSYQSSDEVNQLDWSQSVKWIKDIHYLKGIIAIRHSHGAFRFSNHELVKQHMSFLTTIPEIIAFELKEVLPFGKWGHILVIFNGSLQEQQVVLTEKNSWTVLADHSKASVTSLYTLITKKFIVQPLSCLVAVRT
ncbi:type I pullulanase [Bacillus sp. AK128]